MQLPTIGETTPHSSSPSPSPHTACCEYVAEQRGPRKKREQKENKKQKGRMKRESRTEFLSDPRPRTKITPQTSPRTRPGLGACRPPKPTRKRGVGARQPQQLKGSGMWQPSRMSREGVPCPKDEQGAGGSQAPDTRSTWTPSASWSEAATAVQHQPGVRLQSGAIFR